MPFRQCSLWPRTLRRQRGTLSVSAGCTTRVLGASSGRENTRVLISWRLGPASRDGLGRPARRRLRLGGQALSVPVWGGIDQEWGSTSVKDQTSPLRPLHLSVRPAPTRRGSHCHASSFKAPRLSSWPLFAAGLVTLSVMATLPCTTRRPRKAQEKRQALRRSGLCRRRPGLRSPSGLGSRRISRRRRRARATRQRGTLQVRMPVAPRGPGQMEGAAALRACRRCSPVSVTEPWTSRRGGPGYGRGE